MLRTGNGGELDFPYHPHSNLPLMFLDDCAKHVGMTGQRTLSLASSQNCELEMMIKLMDDNHNLAKPQQELLLWHYRLAHAGLGWIQDLMRKPKDAVGTEVGEAVIKTTTRQTANCQHPKCPACQLGKQCR